jgi:hypothetical protein
MAPRSRYLPGPGPQDKEATVDTNILRNTPEKVPTPPPEETPHACYDGRVFLGLEGEDENGEQVEVIERVACRRCRPESL